MKTNILLLLILTSCNGVKSEKPNKDSSKIINNNNQSVKNQPKITNDLNQKVLGIWTDGNSENASFVINSDSLYSVEKFNSYKYKIVDSTITITYPDFVLISKLSFIKDTMVLESDGVNTKFWKFKN